MNSKDQEYKQHPTPTSQSVDEMIKRWIKRRVNQLRNSYMASEHVSSAMIYESKRGTSQAITIDGRARLPSQARIQGRTKYPTELPDIETSQVPNRITGYRETSKVFN